ncbi:MAG: type II toxin-antitoxin system PemK/MazF family toxin [Alphaproteobacteria bacterium]|nr:type II toxin-antitoxin system PemK/MazF family toxin [Alphaproteobacteria bacterium]
MVTAARFDIFLISLDPTMESQIQKTRPCLVVSPNEMNRHIKTIIIAPMTSTIKEYPTRIPVKFDGKEGSIVLDQIRTIDKSRIVKKLGTLDRDTATLVLNILGKMFG